MRTNRPPYALFSPRPSLLIPESASLLNHHPFLTGQTTRARRSKRKRREQKATATAYKARKEESICFVAIGCHRESRQQPTKPRKKEKKSKQNENRPCPLQYPLKAKANRYSSSCFRLRQEEKRPTKGKLPKKPRRNHVISPHGQFPIDLFL